MTEKDYKLVRVGGLFGGTCYEVYVGGKKMGSVYSHRRDRSIKKRGSRIAYGTSSAVKWWADDAHRTARRLHRLECDTRKAAVGLLLNG